MKLDYVHLLLLLIPVIFLYVVLIYKMKDTIEKIYVSIIFWSLYFYGGIGASSYQVVTAYNTFFIIFIAAFVLSYRIKLPMSHAISNEMKGFFDSGGSIFVDSKWKTNLIIGLYLGICFFSLLYPELKIQRLVSPPSPKGLDALLATIDTENQPVDIISKLVFYAKLLFTPLYFIALWRFVKSPLRLFIFIFLPLYINYCAASYVGRGEILMDIGLWFIVVYKYNRTIRVPLLITTLVAIPFLLILFYTYSIARLGNDVSVTIDGKVIEELFYQEVNFPETFADVVNSGKHVDFPRFVLWLILLPFPKAIFGGLVQVPLINYELSEIILRMNRTDEYFWVKLTGYVSESYYIFGKYFFWIEALLVSRLAKTIFFFLRNIKGNGVIIFYVAITIGFMFSRAGLGAILPNFTNGFLLIYGYMLIKVYLVKKNNITPSISLPPC